VLEARRLVDVGHARGLSGGVQRHLPGHPVGDDVQVARGQRRGQVDRRRLVVCPYRASPSARRGPEAGRPVLHVLGQDPLGLRVAGMKLGRDGPVVERLREDGPADGDHGNPQPAPALAHEKLAYPRLRRGQQAAVRRVGRVLKPAVGAIDADQHLDLVVVRRDVLVGNGPVETETVAAARLEIVGAVAERDAPPVVGPAAEHPRPPPLELAAMLHGRVRVGLAGHAPAPVHRGVIEAERLVGRPDRPKGRRIVCLEHRRLRPGIIVAASLDHEDPSAVHRERVGRLAAGRAGSDHDHVIFVRRGRRGYKRHRIVFGNAKGERL